MIESYKSDMIKRYPFDFRKRVQEAFPDNREVAEWLESFHMDLGSFLRSNADLSAWTPDYVIANIEDDHIDDLLVEARHAKVVEGLYSEWCCITKQGAKIYAGTEN